MRFEECDLNGTTFERCDFKFNGGAAILFSFSGTELGNGNTVRLSRIWMNILTNWPRFNNDNTSGGWPAAIAWSSQSNGLSEGNVSYLNGGEGMTVGNSDLNGKVSTNNVVRHTALVFNILGTDNIHPSGVVNGITIRNNLLEDVSSANWGGNGQFLLAGTMYFHSCNSSATGVDCKTATPYYTDFLTLGGTSGSGTYVLGNVVTDKLELGGTSALTMDLNSNVAFSILKATLLR